VCGGGGDDGVNDLRGEGEGGERRIPGPLLLFGWFVGFPFLFFFRWFF